jgi:hypothetical protein
MVRIARAVAACAALVMGPTLALAQGAGPTPAPSDEGSSAATAAPPASGAPTAPPSASVVPATGYGWSTTPATPKRHIRAVGAAGRQTPDAIMPGFEMLADGSSQLYVELTKPVQYDTKATKGAIVYVLKGAHVDKRNNFNPLVTVHFNTPVTSARLVPHGKDLWFVVDLRANVQPTVTMDAAKDGGAILRIGFPSGSYLPMQKVAPAPAPSPTPPPATSGTPASGQQQ